MEKEFDSSAQIEAYLRDELSPGQRTDLENRLARDPLLQQELTLQQETIAALRAYRRTALKQRLNALDVSDSPRYGRWLGGAAAVVVVGLATWWLLRDPAPPTVVADAPVVALAPAAPPKEAPATLPAETPVVVAAPTTKAPRRENARAAPRAQTAAQPVATPPFPLSEGGQGVVLPAATDEAPLPNAAIRTESGKASNGLNVVIADKNMFHYTTKNNELRLYGLDKAFRKITLANELYLYYEENFYRVEPNRARMTPLERVNDAVLIGQLRDTLAAQE